MTSQKQWPNKFNHVAGAHLLAPRTRVLLATDGHVVRTEFQANFDNDTLAYLEKKHWGRSNIGGLEEAITEVMLLSKCPVLVGTYWSTYSLSAWHIGGSYFYQMGAPDIA